MLVYKYVPNARFFENFKFRFTPAEDLNDLRELVPDIRLRDPLGYAKSIVNRNIQRTYLRLQIQYPHLTSEEVWHMCHKLADEHMQRFDADAKRGEIFDMFMTVTNANVGVLSLTDDPQNEVMWGHYADSNRGFAIGLDSDSDFFQPKADDPRNCGQLMNVLYTETTPVVYVEPGKKLDIPREIYFTKTPRWAYEREWRMIKYLVQADETRDVNGKKIHLFSVPVDTVKEVIFGLKVDPNVANKVESLVRACAPHVELKNVSFSFDAGFKISLRQ